MGGENIPQENLQLVSVPYALYAEKIAGGIQSDDIDDETLNWEDFSQDLKDMIDTQITGLSEADLNAHKIAVGDHWAEVIYVENTFVNAGGNTVQAVLEGLDTTITIKNTQIENLQSAVTNLTAAVDSSDTALQAAITAEEAARVAADAALQAEIDTEESTRAEADNAVQTEIDAEEATKTTTHNAPPTHIY